MNTGAEKLHICTNCAKPGFAIPTTVAAAISTSAAAILDDRRNTRLLTSAVKAPTCKLKVVGGRRGKTCKHAVEELVFADSDYSASSRSMAGVQTHHLRLFHFAEARSQLVRVTNLQGEKYACIVLK